MPNTVEWLNEQRTILLVTYQKESSWDDFHHTHNVMGGLISSAPAPVFIIYHILDFPSGSSMSHIDQVMQVRPDRIAGSTVVLASNNATNARVRTYFEMAWKLHPKRAIRGFSKTMEEAIALAEQTFGEG
jgi:hypothetical protein